MAISSTTPDETLVAASLASPDMFGVLVDRYEEKMRRYVRRRTTLSPQDVDDVLQDIFIKVYINLRGFDTSLSFSSWIYRIAHNHIISWYRKHNVRTRDRIDLSDEDMTHIAPDLLDIEHVQWTGAMRDAINHALETLSDDYREIMVLRFFEEKEYDEISDILKIPPGTVATRLRRAKIKLAELLKDHR